VTLFLLPPASLAQQGDLNIAVTNTPSAEAPGNWTTTLTFTLPSLVQNDLLVETPGELRLIPVAITLDNKQLWLQNTDQKPPASADSVLTWQMNESGFTIHGGSTRSFNQATLSITCIANLLAAQVNPGGKIRLVLPGVGTGQGRVLAEQEIGSLFIK
jgi:hypothetical protein